MNYKVIFILILFTHIPIVFANDSKLPYDVQCTKHKIQRTNDLAQDPSITEADFCALCESHLANTPEPYISIKETFINIPKSCFLAMALRGNALFPFKRYVHCESKNQATFHKRRKFCINENYINTIYKAWKDMAKCFNSSLERQKEMFHLINQESGGILNIKSKTGARCLGQVTIDYVKTINSLISSSDKKNPLQHSEIYTEVTQRCPQLAEKVLKNINFITCQTSLDPHTCLFYTFYGLERNHRIMKNNFNSKSDYMGNREFPKKVTDQYQLPIRLNEVLHITGTTKNGNNIDWVIWDDSELYELWEKIDDSKDLTIKKTPLFKNQEKIEQMLNYWAHNGGQSLVNSSLIKRIEKLKRNISRSCRSSSQENRCLAREQIKQEGRGIDSSLALKMLSSDLLETYPSNSRKRRTEVAQYVTKMIDSSQQVFNYNEGSQNTNSMLNRYKYAQPNLSREEKISFQKQISKVCPKLSFK
ncbi:MAG: hypothetical protein OXM55_03005 [Bdellovibrionales bacterium]|nr:hypothetical protein [Bdellovibrionales bacterium]